MPEFWGGYLVRPGADGVLAGPAEPAARPIPVLAGKLAGGRLARLAP